MANEFKHLLFKRDDQLAAITFNRPPLNILNIEMMNELNRALSEVLNTPSLKVLLIRGEGKAFSAGVDVGEHTAGKVEEMITTFHQIFHILRSIRAITVAAVNGAALGGGCEVATFCDVILASEKAKFGQPEVKVGVLAPVAAVVFPHLIGRHRTLELLCTGEIIDAKEALSLGLANKVFPPEEFEAGVDAFAAKLLSMSSATLGCTKKAVDKALYITVEGGIKAVEEIYLKELMKTEDAHEGLKAFLEKRPPQWKNK